VSGSVNKKNEPTPEELAEAQAAAAGKGPPAEPHTRLADATQDAMLRALVRAAITAGLITEDDVQ
jgi:uncharacterized membrane protein YebE (DUF533 family)